MNGNQVSSSSSKKITREQFVRMLEATLECKSFRFGRQAALAWLAIYPGDLQVNYLQAKLLMAEGKVNQAISILDRLVRLDPEYPEVYRTIAQNTYGVDVPRYELAVTSLVALKEGRPAGPAVKEWGTALRESRHLLDRGLVDEAEQPLKLVLNRAEAPTIGKVLHLKVISQTQDAQSLFRSADLYHAQCPDCVQFNLYLADALMQIGNEPEAVNLLHRSMSMDAAGQVAERLWGENHPYRTIWPDALSIHFEVAIPADVAGRLGWNWMLPFSTTIPASIPVAAPPVETPPDAIAQGSIPDLLPEPAERKAVQTMGDVDSLHVSTQQMNNPGVEAAAVSSEAPANPKTMLQDLDPI